MRRKTRQAPVVSHPGRHFEKYLTGEEPPRHETMRQLVSLASELEAHHPWDFLTEDDLVFVDQPRSDDICFCSVMGAIRQVFSLHVYLGTESYRHFRRLHGGEPFTVGQFFAGQRAMYVEFVTPDELAQADRGVLKAVGRPIQRGGRAPKFRTIRPGYHPWYVTEQEALILAECLLAMSQFVSLWEGSPDSDYWEEEGVYPFMSRRNDGGKAGEFQLGTTKAPAVIERLPILPKLDETRIGHILERRLPSSGAVDVDHFYGAGMVGGVNDRKACIRIAIAVDSETAHAFPPEVGSPESLTGDMLASVVLKAVESSRTLPAELRVHGREFKILLDPLAKALGITVKVAESLPAADFARDQLLEMMGDPGLIGGM
jgi:hypothetical protein